MTFHTAWRDVSEGYAYGCSRASALAQRRIGGAVLGVVALICACIVWNAFAGTSANQTVETRIESAAFAKADALRPSLAHAYAKLAAALTAYGRGPALSTEAAALFDSRFLGAPPGTFVRNRVVVAEAAPAAPETTQSIGGATSSRVDQGAISAAASPRAPSALPKRVAALSDDAPASSAPAKSDKPSIFQRLFGKVAPLTLAYANPEDGAGTLNDAQGMVSGRYDRQTAVYDISAHLVYLPDGTKLEAHSGFGAMLDDPHHTDIRMRGATPATVYELKLREALFHGVRALRLVPVDEDKVFGRSGLLAHTYMLGPNGQSNGCVSFRDYDAFLHAYLSGEIKRLAVVERL